MDSAVLLPARSEEGAWEGYWLAGLNKGHGGSGQFGRAFSSTWFRKINLSTTIEKKFIGQPPCYKTNRVEQHKRRSAMITLLHLVHIFITEMLFLSITGEVSPWKKPRGHFVKPIDFLEYSFLAPTWNAMCLNLYNASLILFQGLF